MNKLVAKQVIKNVTILNKIVNIKAFKYTKVYPDISPFFVTVMSLEEILAEKIRAITIRTKARDVYDLWFLLRKNVKVNKGLVSEKLKFYDKTFDKKLLVSNIKTVENIWMNELKPLVTFLPDFKTVFKQIKECKK